LQEEPPHKESEHSGFVDPHESIVGKEASV